MEVDPAPSASALSGGSPVMASSGTSGSVGVALHPLVIMNISDHWTRIRAQEGKPTQVLGALIGKQEGRNIEVLNSFELVFDVVEGDVIVDLQYYNTKEEQFKQVFKDLEFLGWYTTGGMANEKDIKVHKQICQINESPIFLKLNPLSRNTDQLPISCYESVIDLVSGEATMLFVELQYTLATEEAERIGVDHVARVASAEYMENSIVAEHLVAQHNAIKMLHSRVKLVLDYVKAVQAGEVPRDHAILREACSLSQRLPVLNSEQFDVSFYDQCNEVALMAYLGAITKGCDTINQFVNKFNVLYDRQSMGLRKRGLFF
ncbi:COP9 signalosome complex subunit 6 [Holothuria leucospilota]|uniref:COP9 signalosome complex subunit 6 n=1 Tax=Holothuria leucospilota TaxID=206669 RepID=A0A9Q1BQN6_HOLLE|nr:COP9 signalosome complex subunit 6 [Holothuria leucospilota]